MTTSRHWRIVPAIALFAAVTIPGHRAAVRDPTHDARPDTGSGLAGKWEAELKGDTKIYLFDFDLHVNDSTLWGTLEIPALDRTVPITNGKIKGNAFAFEAFGGWTGTLDGSELKLTRALDEGKTQQLTAHRMSAP